MNEPFGVLDLGVLPYAHALERQKIEHDRVVRGGQPTLILVEHPPVLTLGRKAREGGNIIAPRELLAQHGIEVFEVERGGDVTYHGPGQLVAYAIFPVGRRVRDFLRLLEAAFVRVAEGYGLSARANPGYAGVYVDAREVNGRLLDQKLASIGVAVQRNVAFHGVALNVATNLAHFDLILPCGLQDTQMTSLERELTLRGAPQAVSMPDAKARTVAAFREVFANYDWTLPELSPSLTADPSPAAQGAL
ncbi:lipoyl(octanoyl) transferase LipB [Deinococcus peraridilitoris]|uniref:Octanoyltransferase n=1 Tax=Deinococcus peraridilitoris (strain DSM 19664 / LMG 22246 / CIP 109416 / KR-200) TaxID=937777 RepID=K9ZX52_DEIPD|nr:lipoyl(octanoyl) transferase LipB [Deinococcus peraridilitoris]AFZ66228.1 lipoate-protein ligase B [Deinococcus peraridilitoris DSM 19664]